MKHEPELWESQVRDPSSLLKLASLEVDATLLKDSVEQIRKIKSAVASASPRDVKVALCLAPPEHEGEPPWAESFRRCYYDGLTLGRRLSERSVQPDSRALS
jgi:hypothetical protein